MNEKFKIGFPIGFINIGGITNLTKIISIASNFEDNITAHDIGPGNCLIDDWVRKNSNKKFDENGNISKAGKIDQLITNQIIENFNIDTYSKSLDIKDFDNSFARGQGCKIEYLEGPTDEIFSGQGFYLTIPIINKEGNF